MITFNPATAQLPGGEEACPPAARTPQEPDTGFEQQLLLAKGDTGAETAPAKSDGERPSPRPGNGATPSSKPRKDSDAPAPEKQRQDKVAPAAVVVPRQWIELLAVASGAAAALAPALPPATAQPQALPESQPAAKSADAKPQIPLAFAARLTNLEPVAPVAVATKPGVPSPPETPVTPATPATPAVAASEAAKPVQPQPVAALAAMVAAAPKPIGIEPQVGSPDAAPEAAPAEIEAVKAVPPPAPAASSGGLLGNNDAPKNKVETPAPQNLRTAPQVPPAMPEKAVAKDRLAPEAQPSADPQQPAGSRPAAEARPLAEPRLQTSADAPRAELPPVSVAAPPPKPAESDAAPKVEAPARPAEKVPADSPNPAPVREISVRLSDAHNDRVDVRLVDRGGEVRVAVRTPDAELTRGLRSDLSDLVTRLERSGYQAEVWRPTESSFAQGDRQRGGPQDQDRQGNPQARSNPQQQDRGRDNPRQPRWAEEMENVL